MYNVEVTFHTPNESHISISLIFKYSLYKSKVMNHLLSMQPQYWHDCH